MRQQFRLLFELYRNPIGAASQIIDLGRPWFSICAALLPLLILARPLGAGPFLAFQILILLALGFAPAALLAMTFSRHESFSTIFSRDFLPLLNCLFLSLAAALLPVSVVPYFLGPAFAVWGGLGLLYFAFLTVCCLRTLAGSSFGMAVVTATAGFAGCAGIGFFAATGGGMILRYLASPFLLFFAWRFLSADVRSLGDGYRSRQHFRQQLDIATNNPRDADAHYQLGLIYKQRRQLTEARKRFERAVEIDKHEADPAFQLGRLSSEENKPEQAVDWFRKAAALDDKCSGNEVWRELGASLLKAGRPQEALPALAKYVDRRPYDPEGLYWQGKTFAALQQPERAKESYRACVEAVDTMPSHRRRQVGQWKRLATGEMRGL
jgi:tetratricopeptide (TPR) repeat protein